MMTGAARCPQNVDRWEGQMANAQGWDDLVWASDHDRTALSRAATRGTLRRLSSGLYTGAVDEEPADIVARHLRTILAHDLPGAVIADRSAKVGGTPVGGELFVVQLFVLVTGDVAILQPG